MVCIIVCAVICTIHPNLVCLLFVPSLYSTSSFFTYGTCNFTALGLHHSNTPFSQWNALEWSHERSKTGRLKLDDNKLAEGKEGRESIRHRSRGKRQKKMKLQFDEVVVEVGCV